MFRSSNNQQNRENKEVDTPGYRRRKSCLWRADDIYVIVGIFCNISFDQDGDNSCNYYLAILEKSQQNYIDRIK